MDTDCEGFSCTYQPITNSNTDDISTYPPFLYNKPKLKYNLQLISGRVSGDTTHMDVIYFCRLVPRIVHNVDDVHNEISVA